MKSYILKTIIALTTLAAATSCSPLDSTPVVNKPATVNTPVKKVTTPISTIKGLSVSKRIGRDKHGMPTYSDDSRTRYVRVTAYSHQEREKGAPGRKNAEGTILKYGRVRSAAADWSRLPLGTTFRVKGKPGITYYVDDYGSALAGTNTVDFFFPTLRQMNNWGTRKVTIEIIKMGSFARSARLLKGRLHASHCRKMYRAIQSKL